MRSNTDTVMVAASRLAPLLAGVGPRGQRWASRTGECIAAVVLAFMASAESRRTAKVIKKQMAARVLRAHL